MNDIDADNNEQLVSFIQAKGNLIAQGTLVTLEPLLGSDDVAPGAPKATEVAEFIEENYGPSRQDIAHYIEERTRKAGRSRDATLEDVQRIKELVSKVGNLEFRILANSVDDEKAIKDATDQLNTTSQTEKDSWAQKGMSPPGPRRPGTQDAEAYEINLPRNNKSRVTYGWVELGPQERTQLGLNNASGKDLTKKGSTWREAKAHRNEAFRLPDPNYASGSNRFLLQGALFYSRVCQDRNLPEEERSNKAVEYFLLTRNPEIDPNDPLGKKETPKIDGRYLVSATSDNREGRPAVHFTFNATGGDLFGTLTRKNVPSGSGSEESQIRRHLAIILDGLIMTAPTINSEIRMQGQITGSFTQKEVESLVNILRSGALPASLKPQPVSENTIGATLGQDTIESGVKALSVAFAAVLLFMVAYYRFAGLVACVALLANLLLTVGFMVAVQATFTLPGLAGLVLMLGMAVDANVLIYERFREERERGASLPLAIRNAYERSFPTIIDTHLSSMFTAIVLYVVGNDQLKGFGVSLTVGLIISLFTSLYITRFIFDLWISKGWLKQLKTLGFFSKPTIDFMGARKFWFSTSVALTIVGAVLFIGRLPYNLNIDFVGGTAYGGILTEARGLSTTTHASGNEVLGLRDLMSDTSQQVLLQVPEEGVREIAGSEGREFLVSYREPNGSTTPPRTITLANKIEAPTAAERQTLLRERLQQLPDVSIEQTFASADRDKNYAPGFTAHFTIRTSEKETEIVSASLERLLRKKVDGGGHTSLLRKVYMTVDPLTRKDVKLRFFKEAPPEGFDPVADLDKPPDKQFPRQLASPSFVKTLLTRELRKTLGVQSDKPLPYHVEMHGEGRGMEGRYEAFRVKFEPEISQDDSSKVQQALLATAHEFSVRPLPERLENFDSQLATETRLRAFYAILASWAAILVYVWFRFGNWTFGLAAVLCLVHDVFFTLGAITICHYIYQYMPWLAGPLLIDDFKIDLTTVAALLTLVGYSINDKIVVYDRMREVRGKRPDLTPALINETINQALSRTLLTGISVLLVLIVLYIFGGEGVHLFAFVMTIGMIVGTYSSIYVASPLLLIFGEGASASPVKAPGPTIRSEPSTA
jgi:SecD/SecF fusion protein